MVCCTSRTCGPYTSKMSELVHSSSEAQNRAPEVRARPPARAPARTNDPARTMAGILAVATREFADKGLSGARIDEIAQATHTSKRMIYYYYGNKQGLYLAVLEESYRRIRKTEAELQLQDMEPVAALRALVEFSFDHHSSNEDYVRLVMSENMQRGAYLAQSRTIQQLNQPVIASIAQIYRRGVQGGVFREGLDPVDIHASISALTFYNVSNHHTFDLIFGRQRPLADPARRASIADMVLRFVLA